MYRDTVVYYDTTYDSWAYPRTLVRGLVVLTGRCAECAETTIINCSRAPDHAETGYAQ